MDKKRKEILAIKIGISSQNQVIIVENAKKRKYDALSIHLGQLNKMKSRIIPWVMTWGGTVETHKYCLKELEIPQNIEAYMQSLSLRSHIKYFI